VVVTLASIYYFSDASIRQKKTLNPLYKRGFFMSEDYKEANDAVGASNAPMIMACTKPLSLSPNGLDVSVVSITGQSGVAPTLPIPMLYTFV
jgi:hypothetical protein